MRRALLIVLCLVALMIAPNAVAGQTAPVVPDPSDCQGLSQRSVAPLFASPTAELPATPTAEQAGKPADDATVAAAMASARAVIACLNAGDFFPILTQLSDGYLTRTFVPGPAGDPLGQVVEPFVNALRGCEVCKIAPREGEDQLAIAEVANVRVLADGRVGYHLTLASPSGANVLPLFVVLVDVDGRWLVDEVAARLSVATPAA